MNRLSMLWTALIFSVGLACALHLLNVIRLPHWAFLVVAAAVIVSCIRSYRGKSAATVENNG